MRNRKRVRDFGEVFTPPHIVRDMCDLVEPTISDPASNVLEPACGNGNFLVEILARKLANCTDDRQRFRALRSLYGVDLLADNVAECQARLVAMMPEHMRRRAEKIVRRNIVQGDFLNGRDKIWFLRETEGRLL